MSSSYRSALFIDFDNIFTGLQEYEDKAARKFATDPSSWIGNLSSFQRERRIILRKCYINPALFSRYRTDFVRAACEVVDCPSLTSRGKSSADIHMALDALDALGQQPSFDEFIVMSADADFTPLLLRLRRHDKRMLVITTSDASQAYVGIADAVIGTETFVDKFILSREISDQRRLSGGDAPERLQELAAKLSRIVSESEDKSIAAHEIPGILKEEPDFYGSDWYGCFGLRRLVETLAKHEPESLRIVQVENDWILARPRGDQEGAVAQLTQFTPERLQELASKLARIVSGSEDKSIAAHEIPGILKGEPDFYGSDWYGCFGLRRLAEALARREPGSLRVVQVENNWILAQPHGDPEGAQPRGDLEAVDRFIGDQLGRTGAPMRSETLASLIKRRFGNAADGWFGYGDFADLLRKRLPGLNLRYVRGARSFVLDPDRHQISEDELNSPSDHQIDENEDQELHALVQRLRRVANIPPLRSDVYAKLFGVIADVVGSEPYDLNRTGLAVRDRMTEEGIPVSRQAVNWVLRGLCFAGCSLDGTDDAARLAERHRANVLRLVELHTLSLSEEEKALIDKWLPAGGAAESC